MAKHKHTWHLHEVKNRELIPVGERSLLLVEGHSTWFCPCGAMRQVDTKQGDRKASEPLMGDYELTEGRK